jgi:hypothetical protein
LIVAYIQIVCRLNPHRIQRKFDEFARIILFEFTHNPLGKKGQQNKLEKTCISPKNFVSLHLGMKEHKHIHKNGDTMTQ